MFIMKDVSTGVENFRYAEIDIMDKKYIFLTARKA